MNNFNEKLKLYFKKRTQRVSITGLSVTYDWYFILSFAVVLTCLGLAAAIFSYRDISNGTVFESSAAVPQSSTVEDKSKEIEKVVEYLQQR